MSLVERALKKLQESRGTAPAARAYDDNPPTEPIDLPPAPGSQVQTGATASPGIAPPPAAPVQPARVVHIDFDALRHSELLPPHSQERQLAGEYRQIKRPLIANALGQGVPKLPKGHRIMVASALPGDGKTFTSINLALSFAKEQDLSVVLVDADVAKAHLSRTFGLYSEPGLMDLLRDESLDVESLLLPTNVPGLSLLPAGKGSDTAPELLASARMEDVAEQMCVRDPSRIVLFDSAPLLMSSEPLALANVVGQIVLVVRAGVTPQSAVFDAIELLGEGRHVGLVLNQADEQIRPGYYYQQYGIGDEAEVSAAVASGPAHPGA